jgi:hypothetical protein
MREELISARVLVYCDFELVELSIVAGYEDAGP